MEKTEKIFSSKWGEEDEVGAFNEIKGSNIVDAAKLIKIGKIYSLGQIIEVDIPVPAAHGPFFYLTAHSVDHGLKHPRKVPGKYKEGRSSTTCRLEMSDHTGTHIDGLNHCSIGKYVYNGVDATEITTTFGTTKLGMETVPPVFCTGVLLDVARTKGVDVLPDGYNITDTDLKDTLRKQGSSPLESPIAVLIRTGQEKYWKTDNRRYMNEPPGIGMAAAEWLVEQGAVLVGADTHPLEVVPFDMSRDLTVHQYLLAKNGVHILENLTLNQLSSDMIYEFAFICLPLPIKGGTGSPIRPVAVL